MDQHIDIVTSTWLKQEIILKWKESKKKRKIRREGNLYYELEGEDLQGCTSKKRIYFFSNASYVSIKKSYKVVLDTQCKYNWEMKPNLSILVKQMHTSKKVLHDENTRIYKYVHPKN